MTLLEKFVTVFDVWQEAGDYISLMFDEAEMRLIAALEGRAVTPADAAEILSISPEEAQDFLENCYRRCLLNKETEAGERVYKPANFAARLNHFARFGAWDHIPPEGRQPIERRCFDDFIAKHRANVEKKKRGLPLDASLPNDRVMLLPEVEEMIDASSHIAVVPCDCRRLAQNCSRPVETCIYLDDTALDALDRGHGRSLSKEEAKELLRWADKKGLMHTADSNWQERGLSAICNCCACDCYPFRAGVETGSKGFWPESRYIAAHDREKCTVCGVCVKRCHFDAFYFAEEKEASRGKTGKTVLFAAEKCWGCGLCANTCPEAAIAMSPLE